MKRFSGAVSGILFAVAWVLGALAVWEKAVNLTGRTLVFVGSYAPSRLIEWSAVVLLFVIALHQREIMRLTRDRGSPG